MADVYNAVYLHLVWTTQERLPCLTPEVEKVIYACIQETGEALRSPVLAIGGVIDHIHVLVHLPTTISISELVKRLKGASSHLANQTFASEESFFKWQGGYGVFPVGPKALGKVIDYIERQDEHHRNKTLVADLEMTCVPFNTVD